MGLIKNLRGLFGHVTQKCAVSEFLHADGDATWEICVYLLSKTGRVVKFKVCISAAFTSAASAN